MKNLLTITLLMLWCASFSQSAQRSKDALPVYQGVIEAAGKDQNQLYGILKEWIAKTYKSADDVIQVDDRENGKLVLKGLDTYIISGPMNVKVPNKCFHTITLETKPEKFRYTIEITEVETGTSYQPMLGDVLLSDPPLKPNGNPYSGAMLNNVVKQKEQHLARINDLKESLIKSLEEIALMKGDDW